MLEYIAEDIKISSDESDKEDSKEKTLRKKILPNKI